MYKRISVILIAIVYATIAHAQDCTFYYPETEGALMVYQQYDKKDKPIGKTSHQVLEYSQKGNGSEARIELKTFDKKDELTSTSVLNVRCEAGIFYFDMESYLNQEMMAAYESMDVKMDATDLEMPSKLSEGQTLKDGSIVVEIYNAGMKLMSMEIVITNRKVLGKETVTTPAGTFDCYKITQTTTAKMPIKFVTTSTEWFNPGTGLVKSESFSSSGDPMGRMELVELRK